jgi:CRP/FNR family transcriptional regulator, dissimilatory nitrate respiration regulator
MGISLSLSITCHEAAHPRMIGIMSISLLPYFESLKAREFDFATGQPVFYLADTVRLIHIVRSGSIILTRHQLDGAALILQRAVAGSVLAEASVYSERYHCAAEAQLASKTWAVPRREFRKLLASDSDFALAWSRYLAHEVQRARLQSEIVSLKTVAARINAWIAWNGPLPPKGQWTAIADQIGVSREAFYRELSQRRARSPS